MGTRTRLALTLLTVFALAGSGLRAKPGPLSANVSSDTLPTLEQRVEFLERYVTFRRTYNELDFKIEYADHSGMPPGPTEWDISVIAEVPPAELDAWIPAGVAATASADTGWLTQVPGRAKAAGIHEWYTESGRVVGVDRERSIVAYHLWAY